MHKYSELWKHSVVGLAMFFAYSAIAMSSEPDQSWDFSGKNQPYFDNLWQFDGRFDDLNCQDKNDVMYENYARQHPQFRPQMASKNLRTKWRHSLITKGNGGLDSINFCFYKELIDRWHQVSPNRKALLYCGKLADYIGESDLDGTLAIAELTYYAMLGRKHPLILVVRADTENHRVQLNSDIQYYLQLHLNKFISEDPPIGDNLAQIFVPLMDPEAGENLTAQSRIFLENSFERGDHQAVLDATAPCQTA